MDDSQKITPKCLICKSGNLAIDGTILCQRRGVMQPNSVCKKFVYDPLKRIPKRPSPTRGFKPDDFSL